MKLRFTTTLIKTIVKLRVLSVAFVLHLEFLPTTKELELALELLHDSILAIFVRGRRMIGGPYLINDMTWPDGVKICHTRGLKPAISSLK